MKDSKYYRKIIEKNKKKIDKSWITKLLLSIIILLLCLIVSNLNLEFKDYLKDTILEKDIKFSNIHKFYDKYIGSMSDKKTSLVVNEESSIEQLPRTEEEGIYMIKVGKDYVIDFLQPGIIVYIGEKDNLGNTVIVQGNDGVDLWYSNVLITEYSLYDYVSKGDVLGISNGEEIKLTIVEDGNKLKYEEYFEES